MFSAYYTYPPNAPRITKTMVGAGVGIAILSGVCLLISRPLFAIEKPATFLGVSPEKTKIEKEIERANEKARWDAELASKYSKYRINAVTEGVVHIRMTYYTNSRPVKLNIVEINPKLNENLVLKPAMASEVLNQKTTVRNIANKNNAIVAVNGTYFKPDTGVPLGTLMIDKKPITGAVYNRVSMGITPEGFIMGRINYDINARYKDKVYKIDNINQSRMSMYHTLVYTKDWGQVSPPTPKNGIQIAVQNDKIIQVSSGSLSIPQNGYVIVSNRKKAESFFNENLSLLVNKPLSLNIELPAGWQEAQNIISGGPYLVKNSEVFVDAAEQKLQAITGKNPRTAIGYTPEGTLIIIAADGRENTSVGLTLWELAKLMKNLGCKYAMNLDGGGSTVMYVKGVIVNSPAYKEGINISNAFTVIENAPSQVAQNNSQT